MDENDRTLVLQRLEPFVGRWTLEALFPVAEPTGPAGQSTFEWMLGGTVPTAADGFLSTRTSNGGDDRRPRPGECDIHATLF
jgi:hypothetical protein